MAALCFAMMMVLKFIGVTCRRSKRRSGEAMSASHAVGRIARAHLAWGKVGSGRRAGRLRRRAPLPAPPRRSSFLGRWPALRGGFHLASSLALLLAPLCDNRSCGCLAPLPAARTSRSMSTVDPLPCIPAPLPTSHNPDLLLVPNPNPP